MHVPHTVAHMPMQNPGILPAAGGPARYGEHCAPEDLDGMCRAYVAQCYRARLGDILARLRMIASTGTGQILLADIRELGRLHGIHPTFGPSAPMPDVVMGGQLDGWHGDGQDSGLHHSAGPHRLADGQILLDPLLRPVTPCAPEYPQQLAWLAWDLVNLRNMLAEHVLPPATPVLSQDVLPSFIAELNAGCSSAAWRGSADVAAPARLQVPAERASPAWSGPGAVYALEGGLPVWIADASKPVLDDVMAVMRAVRQSASGQCLLNELRLYEKGGATMMVAAGQGQSGVSEAVDGTPLWLFDGAELGRRCTAPDLSGNQARAYTAFWDLLALRNMLARKLGLLEAGWTEQSLQARFYDEIKAQRPDEQPRPPNWSG